MYGKEFDGYLFEDAMEETDKLLEGKVAVREEEIEKVLRKKIPYEPLQFIRDSVRLKYVILIISLL